MNTQPSLFEKTDRENSALEELQRIQTDPMVLLNYCQNMIAQQAIQIKEMKPKVEMYESFLDSNGELSCTDAADVISLYYITPQGKKERMGNHYFLQVLYHDRIIRKNVTGYSIYAEHKHHGRTKPTTKNNQVWTHVLFNAKGVDYLVKKYKDDKRVWRAINRQLYCEEA